MEIKIVSDIGILVLIPVARSVAGWTVKALEDNKITKFELRLLVSTIVRVGIIGIAGYLSLNGLGLDVPALAAAAGAILADKLFKSLKENKVVRQ